MILDSNIASSWRARPRGFVALMGLYESNYLRFMALAGPPAGLRDERVSQVADDCTLLLSVLERTPYTSTLRLTYLLPDPQLPAAFERVPDLALRVYHDARLLEALGADPGRPERELDRRWQRNMMLNKWLEYCAERGHCLSDPATT